MAGGRLFSTAKLGLSATPHTVLGTHAGAVSHSPQISSTSVRLPGTDRGGACPVLSVRPLPRQRTHLQPLRPRPDLLRWKLRTKGAPPGPTRSRPALPGKPPRPYRPCLRARRYRRRQKNVTHQGSPLQPTDDLLPEDLAAANERPSPGGFTRPAAQRCHRCGCRCPDFVRQDFLRRRWGSRTARTGAEHDRFP